MEQNGADSIFERLDRGLTNNEWMNMFPWSLEEHLMVSASKHLLLVFNVSAQPSIDSNRNGTFKFENLWVRRNDFEEAILRGWNNT